MRCFFVVPSQGRGRREKRKVAIGVWWSEVVVMRFVQFELADNFKISKFFF